MKLIINVWILNGLLPQIVVAMLFNIYQKEKKIPFMLFTLLCVHTNGSSPRRNNK